MLRKETVERATFDWGKIKKRLSEMVIDVNKIFPQHPQTNFK